MRRNSFYLSIFSGFLCLFAAALLLLPVTSAQDEPEYEGINECEDCHRDVVRNLAESPHTLTMHDDEDRILADFEQGEAIRMVTFPEEDEPRAFTEDDIEFIVGSGRYVQRYLYEVARNDLRVFPAEWNVLTQEWQPFTLAENWDDPAYDWEDNCAYCHTTGFDVERGRPEDEGVVCEACHGPGSIHAELASDAGRRPDEDELIEIRSAIHVSADAQTCGQCHSRGTNPDGLPYPANYRPGENLSDYFTPVAADDPVHWWNSRHARQPNMQYNEWLTSGHASALTTLVESGSAEPYCLTCHSADYNRVETVRARVESGDREGTAPESLTPETAQFGVTCATCHNVHAENENHNSFITVESYALCAGCHTDPDASDGLHHAMRQMYEGTTLIEEVPGIPSAHFSAEDGPNCLTCHMPRVPVDSATRPSHTFEPILPGDVLDETTLRDSCSECHAAQAQPAQMRALIDDVQASTQARLDAARAAVSDSTPEWISLALDMVEGDGSMGIHNPEYTNQLLFAAENELGIRASAAGDANLGEQIDALLPDVTPAAAAPASPARAGGLTLPSYILLGIGALIVLVAGFAFFRSPADD